MRIRSKECGRLTGILDTVFREHAVRPVADTAHNLDVACSILGDWVFRFRFDVSMPSLFVLVAYLTPFAEMRVT